MKKEKAVSYTIEFAIISFITAVIIFMVGLGFTNYLKKKNLPHSSPVFEETRSTRIVIDPGHGGEDAGAIASDGTLEKDLNLEIANLIKVILELNGCNVTMTRQEDTLLYDKYGDLNDYTGHKKVYDLKNRLKIASEYENSIYVGIHMNKFPIEKYSGLQVYYSSNNDLSYDIANEVKDAVTKSLQPHNTRPLKRADNSIYILDKATIPAVLIECGFMSNEMELSLLKDKEYQKSLALCLFSSLVRYA